MDETNNVIRLTDEEGVDKDFEFLDLVNYGDQEYIVLLPCDDEESGEIVILQIESEAEDRETYVGVQDGEVLNAVFSIFKEKFKNDFDFLDD